MQTQRTEISISTATIFKILAIVAALWLLYIIKPILLILFVSLIFSALIDPLANWFEERHIPRGLAVILIDIIILGIVALVVWVLIPPLLAETQSLFGNFGSIWESGLSKLGRFGQIVENYNIIPQNIDYKVFQPGVSETVQGIFSTIGGFIIGFGSVMLTFAMAFYMVVEEDAIRKMLRQIVPSHFQPFVAQFLGKARLKLGSWLRAQLILSIVVGVATYIGLAIIGVQYAAVLGIVAGIFELVPYVGPVFSGAVAVFLSFAQSGLTIQPLLTLGLMVLVQQVENNVLVPKVMQRNVGLNPIVSIVAILVGAKLGGLVGVLLAIPVATFVSVFMEEILEGREREN